MRTIVIAVACAALAIGCSYPPLDGTQQQGTDGGTTGHDGGGGSNTCDITASYGTSSLNNQQAGFSNHANAMFYDGNVDTASPPTMLTIELDIGGTYFPQQINGNETVPLANESQGSSCDACVVIYTQCSGCDLAGDGNFANAYIANGGTLQLNAPSDSTIAGTLTNATFQHVMQNTNNGATTPINDGCTTKISSMSWSAAVQTLN